jgi:hypothetical protein
MPTPAADNPATPQARGGAAPAITAAVGYIVTGTGFLPDHNVTIRITRSSDDVTDYIAYTTDANGRLYAALPTDPTADTLQVSASDHRLDPASADGLLWSNTCPITIGARDA